MKKSFFSMFVVAGLLLTACSDKDMAAGGNGQEGEMVPEGYMSLNINLPTTPTTRAANDNFDDGTENEYRVSDCALLLFEGETEADAVLLNAQSILYPFDDEKNDGNPQDQITTSYQVIAKVEGHTSGKKLWALALLNYKNFMSIGLNGVPVFEKLKKASAEDSGEKKMAAGAKLADIRALITDTDVSSMTGVLKNYFFMTNAVLCEDEGGRTAKQAPDASKVFQLAYMNPDRICKTVEEARKNPAGEIFVERAVAKATLKINPNAVNVEFAITEDNIVKWAIDPEQTVWTIDNMEPATYITRNPGIAKIEEGWPYISYSSDAFKPANYRFVGNLSTRYLNNAFVDKDYYRTYWCIDPQYSDENMTEVDGNKNSVNMLPAKTFYSTGADNPLYCFENTFDVKHQSYRNTTRAIVKVVLKGYEGKSFYTVNGGIDTETEDFYLEADAKSYVMNYIVNNKEVKEIFAKYLALSDYEILPEDFDVTYERNDAGLLKVTKVELAKDIEKKTNEDGKDYFKAGFRGKFEELVEDADSEGNSKLISNINSSVVIRQYKDGVMYYEARFKHFAGSTETGVNADLYTDLAPWNSTEYGEVAPSGGSTKAAYPDFNAKNYLGRYGMVRNNWYDVEIEAFKKPGYPADPSGQVENEDFDDPDTPDDNLLEYIAAKIHVLSWAKRTQKWTF